MTLKPLCLIRAALLAAVFLSVGPTAHAQIALTNSVFFTNTILLDGDISDFFLPNSTNARPGVGVAVDSAGEVPAVPGSRGLGESPLDRTTVKSGVLHPSGFNQRRILSAYNPGLNGGTIFIGVDLPGGTGSPANPNFRDALGPTRSGADGLVAIRPFDADGNGDPQTIGQSGSTRLFRCGDPLAAPTTVDVINCTNPAAGGFTDAVDRDQDIGNLERYGMTILFADGTQAQVELFENNFTPFGKAALLLTSIPPRRPFGVLASLDASNNVLGVDVEFAITNVNNSVEPCGLLLQVIRVNSGSLQDGSSNGEDFNTMSNRFALVASLDLSQGPVPLQLVPGQPLGLSGTVRNSGQIDLTNVCVTNIVVGVLTNKVLGPVTLRAGESLSFSNAAVLPLAVTNCSLETILTAIGLDACGGARLTATTSTNVFVAHLLQVVCPTNLPVQCLSSVPSPDPAAVMVTSTAGQVEVRHLSDIRTTNGAGLTVTRTYEARDGCSNRATCVQLFTVRDTQPPALLGVPTNRTYQCLSEVPAPLRVTAVDNCDGTNVVVTLRKTTNGTCPTLVVCTWSSTDRSSNSITVVQTNTVLDTTPPMLVGVPPPRTFQCLSELLPPARVTALDNCDGTNLTVTLSKSTNGTAPTLVICTWTAADRCGNVVSASQTNTIQDITRPTLVGVPTNRVYQCLSEVPLPPRVTAVDNCDGTNVVVILSKTTNGICPTLVVCTWSATDRSSNSITVAQTNTVLDTTPPMLVGVPPPRTFQCLSELPPPARVTAVDNCDGTNLTVTLSKSTNGAAPTLVICTWTAADRCGNVVSASQTNTVQDITRPTLVGVPTNRTYQCLSDVPVPPGVTAVDNCDGTNVVVTLSKTTNGTCPTLVVCTWSATDRSGNSITVAQTNTVRDTTPPMLVGVPPPRAFQCLTDLPPPAAVTALDNCEGTNLAVMLTKSTNGTRPTVVVCTWTAVDRCGNVVSASQTNTVQDITPPTLVGVPTNATYQCLSEVPVPPGITAVDNCDGTNLVVTLSKRTNGTCPTLVVCTWSATDRSGNSITVAQTNTVLDTTPPMLVGVPPPRVFQCLSELPPPARVTALDNCDGTNLTVTLTKSTNGTRPTLVICTWTAADRCGNRASASQTNAVQDITPPMLVGVPTNRTYECLSEVAAPPRVTAVDNCDGTNLVVTLKKLTNGTCPILVVCTWSATDRSSNSITVAQTNTVLDTTPPLLVGVPPPRVFQCLSELPPPARVTALDNCDGTNLTVTLAKITNGTRPTLVICTWMAADRCGNRVSASQTNTVQDPTPPTLVGVPTNRTYQCLSEVPVPPRVTAVDNCDGTNLVVTLSKMTNGTCPTLVICVWSATDSSGNSITVGQTNTVLDITPPLLVGVPASRTFQCLSELPPAALVTAIDNCDGTNLTVTLTKSTNGTRPTLVICTWTAADRCGNRVSASQTNTVQDPTPPTLVGVPTNRTYQCLSEVPVPPRVTAVDNCDGTNLVVTLNKMTNGTCPTLVICVWSATDGSGNSITVAQTNTVLDITPPLLVGVPASRTFQCLSELPPAALVTAIDNCDGTNLTVTLTKSTNGTRPTLVICTWTAADRCGNRVSASQTNTVQDPTPPTLVGVPTNRTYQCLSEVPVPPRVTAVDNCDGTNLVVTLSKMTNGTCPTLVICVWSATDSSGNSITVGQTNTVLDITPPLLVGVPASRTFQCLSELPPAALVTAIDNCDGTNLTVTLTKSTNGTRPTLVICTWTASDRCGNRVSASQTNTVQDPTPPTLVGVPTNRTYQCLSEVPVPPRVTAVDNCDGTNLVVTLSKMTNGTCPTLVICVWSATDGSGNSITVAQTNTVLDITPPLLVGVPASRTFQCLSELPPPALVTAIDNCDGTNLTVTLTKSTNGTRPTLVICTWTAADRCGNRVSASQTNTVQDITPPLLVGVPTNRTYQCLSEVPVPPRVTAVDDCDGTNLVVTLSKMTNGTCPTLVICVWSATDSSGNSITVAQTNTVLDTTPPLLVGVPPPRVFQCLSELPPPARVTALDNCDGTNLTVTLAKITNGTRPTLVICTWMAADRCGNRVSASQTNTVQDPTPPTLVGVPTNRTYQCLSEVPVPPRVTAVDNCDGTNLVVTLNKMTNGTCPTLVICVWSATDGSGNSITVAQTNTVLDITPPLLVGVPASRTFQCLSELPPAALVTAIDNCDGTNLTVTLTKSTNGTRPTLVICTWTAADRCGNRVSASQTNTVQDPTPPTLVGVPTNRTYQCLSEVPVPPRVTAVDNCDGTNLVVTLSKMTNGTCPTLVICVWSATDSSGNSITVGQTNTVLDITPPLLVGVPASRTFQCLSELPPAALVTAIDNCDGTNLTVTLTKSTNGTRPTLVICTWTASDRCGNRVSASQTNTVQDPTPPTLVGVPTNRTYQCLSEVPVPPRVTAVDNCDGTNLVVTLSKMTNGTCPTLVICVWSATDGSGNSITVAQTNTVLDITPPLLVGVPASRTFQCLSELPPPALVTAIDNCDGTNLTVTLTKSTNGTRPTLVICTWTAADRCGNRVSASQTNTVQDPTPPTLVGVPTNRTYQCLSEVPVPPRVTAVDNCDGSNLVVTLNKMTNGTCPTLVICVWSATDSSGNSITVGQTNTVLDITPPLLVGVPPPRVFQCLSELPPPARVTALDNCDGTNLTVTLAKITNGTRPTLVICTWTAADRCGNRVSASQTNTVQDITPPLLVGVPTNRTYQCLSEVPVPPRVTAVDDCDGTNLIVTLSKMTNGTCPTLVICVWSATDSSGNSITVAQTNTVLDITPPLLAGVPSSRTFQCLSELPPPALVTAIDNCDGTNLTVTLTKSTNGIRPTLVICTWTAADRCGNRVSASQTNTVQDITPPLLVGVPTNRTYQCLNEVPAPPRVTAVDNCDGTNLVMTLNKTTNGNCPTLVVCTWSATDRSGNSITLPQTNTVIGDRPVLVSAPTDQAVAAGAPATFCIEASSACPLTYSWLKDGVVIAGANSPCYTVPAVTAADSGQYCARVTGDCGALTNCARLTVLPSGAPCLALTKMADRPLALPGGPVTYTYTVTNCGSTTLTDIVISDDNGTPSFTNDDFIVAVVASLAPGATRSFTRTVPVPMRLCDDATGQESGLLITEVLADGNIKATFIQDFSVNDNTYGVNSIGWGNKGHKFSNLTGSDQATFQFKNGAGQVVLEFKEDYISASTAYPSGFGTLGVTGGDGGIKVGAAADVLFVSTSLTENLNKPPFLNHLVQYTVDSPALSDPNSGLWEYRMTYTVVVAKTAFGASGFGSVVITAQHNSPGKRTVRGPTICPGCVTNVATATATAGGVVLTAPATATVCVSEGCAVCDLRYPFASSNPRTSVVFNENEILRAFSTGNVGSGDTIKLWYNDEHAMVLGVRQVVVKTSSGSTTTDYPVTPLPAGCGPNGCSAINPLVGSTLLSGDQAGTDVSDRPMFPALFLTDITSDPSSLAGDWQFGGTPIPPHAVFGTWKGAVRVVDKTKSSAKVEVNPDADPPKNNWNLDGGDPVPAGAVNQGYGAEARWNVDDLGLIPGHTYRAYFMVHDGDQNKRGGDVGHGCVTICFEGNPSSSNHCIKVTQEIACLLPGDNCTPFAKVATGFKGLQDPAFCYRITVTNCGAVALANVTVTDDKLGNLSAHFPPTLAPGQAAVQVFKMAWSVDTTNKVTATGRSVMAGTMVTGTDSAIARVTLASINCAKIVMSPDDLDGAPSDNHVALPNDGLPHNVTFSVTVTAGSADLANVTILDPVLSESPFNCVLPAPFSLPANSSVNLVLCTVPVNLTGDLSRDMCANPLLNAAASCTVLLLDGGKVDINGPAGGVEGDVCIGPKGKLSISGEQFVTGRVRLAQAAKFDKSGPSRTGGVSTNVDLSAEIQAALAVANAGAALPCTQTFDKLKGTQTITGNGGLSVICVKDITLNGEVITLVGGPSDMFIFNIEKELKLDGGSKIVVTGGLQPGNVLYNLLGNGPDVALTGGGGGVNCCNSTLDGTVLAPDRKIRLSPGLVRGAVISGKEINLSSGASVRCGPGTTNCLPLLNLVSVTAELDPNQPGACASDFDGNPIQVIAQCDSRVDCTVAPMEARECERGIVAFRLRYTGPTRPGPLTLKFTAANSSATTTYNFGQGLTTGDVLSLSAESDPGRPWTLDATKHGASRLGTKTTVYFNGVLTEILHTSCSCRMNNFVPGLPACLDASSPNNPTGTKGEPSPNFLVLDFK